MRLARFCSTGLLAATTIILGGNASAETLRGAAYTAGWISVSKDAIAFSPEFVSPPDSKNSGSFAGLSGGTVNSTLLDDLTSGPVKNTDFLTFFDSGRAVDFDLNYIQKGNGPANSPFFFFQRNDTVEVALSFLGTAYYPYSSDNSFGGTPANYSLFFVLSGESEDDLIHDLAAGQIFAAEPYSAVLTAPPANDASDAPEPASWLLMSAGLLGAGFIARRKAQAAKSNA